MPAGGLQMRLQRVGEQGQALQRLAQVVARRGEEGGLGPVGGLRCLAGGRELGLGALAFGDIAGQPRHLHHAPGGIEFRLRGFLKPHLSAVGTHIAKRDDIRGVLGADVLEIRLETLLVVGVNALHKCVGGKRLVRVVTHHLRGIFTALRRAFANPPAESDNTADLQRALQPRRILHHDRFVAPPLGKQRSKDERAQACRQDDGLRGQHPLAHGQRRIAEHAGAVGRRPHHGDGDDRDGCRREARLAARGEPQREREEQRDDDLDRPRLARQTQDEDRERRNADNGKQAFESFPRRRPVACGREHSDQERRNRDDAERIGDKPRSPDRQHRRGRGVEHLVADGCDRSRERGRNDCSGDQPKHALERLQTKRRAEEALNQRCDDHGLAGVARCK